MKRPNFFIVGAPKCGTTALQTYLSRHPDIYMPSVKESHHFATDLLSMNDFYRSAENYLALFRDAEQERHLGEASVWYLYSEAAVHNIFQFDPHARIIVMLRNPVELLQSYHAALVFYGEEDIFDLEKALAAEPDRRQGRLVFPGLRFRQALFYSEVVRLSESLERYFLVFERSQVHVIVYDDLKADPASVYMTTLKFLGADPSFTTDFSPVNTHRRARLWLLNRVLHPHAPFWVRVGRRFLPAYMGWVEQELKRLNTKHEPRPPLNSTTQNRLLRHYTPEIERLSVLLQRDLRHWLSP